MTTEASENTDDGARLILGPLLRYVGTTTATVWVETDAPADVEVLGNRATTFNVLGHHYALVLIQDLEPGTINPYEVRLSGRVVWPTPDGRPRPTIRTREGERQALLVFGSCRVGAPERAPYTLAPSDDPKGLGVDALWTYSLQLQAGSMDWPDGLLLMGDQVYVDEVPPKTAEFIRARRNVDEPPGETIADFQEYAELYRESWSDPDIRWLLATVPSTMIFDDHEVSDDWNISQSWVDEVRALPWWDERITAAFMAYWVYQHLGNLSPPELAEETLFEQVQQDEDAGPRLRALARKWDRESAASRWAYYRDFGRSRLVVIDSRAARVTVEGRRDMVDEEEWEWIAEHARGRFDHLIIATTLPVFLPPGIHHLEAWNEAVCDGAWGALAGRLGERLRRAVDLEHWAAYQQSFQHLTELLRSISGRDESPATIIILSGDVHTSYVASVDLGPESGASRVHQVVCSPFRNPLSPSERRVVRMTGSRAAAFLFSALARASGVRPPAATWEISSRRTFNNSIGELALDHRRAQVTLFRSAPESERGSQPGLVRMYETDLAAQGPEGRRE